MHDESTPDFTPAEAMRKMTDALRELREREQKANMSSAWSVVHRDPGRAFALGALSLN